jgi:GNAT superfamily N-acetyltransferase
MELLNEKDYQKVTGPLSEVTINNLFARSVVEKKVTGKVYVDNVKTPKTFYIVHPYGISLLFGDSHCQTFNEKFLDYSLNTSRVRSRHEWMLSYPDDWHKVLSDLYSDKMIKSADNINNVETAVIELNTRTNFKFNQENYKTCNKAILPDDCKIVRTDMKTFKDMKGLVIPASFWDTADDFINNGVGFSLYCNEKLAATAFSAFIHDDKLEIGIETITDYRSKGFARLVCSALIDYSIKNGFEPVWACKKENTGSFNLAQKLGFEVSMEIPYYRFSD